MWAEESFTGADCTGSSGDSNRLLILTNINETSNDGFLVFVDGLVQSDTYSVTHLTSNTRIIFLNALFDEQKIVVKYQGEGSYEYQDVRTDIQGMISEHGQSGVLSRQTETTDSMGHVTATTEETYNIVTLINDITKKDRTIHEMGLAIKGNVKAFFYEEYPDSITGNGVISVQAGDEFTGTDGKKWKIEQILGERYFGSREIFRVGVLRSINLEQ
jgi:hypothetical protein